MIVYEELTESDLSDLTESYERYLNSGQIIRNSIREAFASGDYFGIRASLNGIGIGYFTFQKSIAFTYPHEELERRIRDFVKGEKTVTVDALMVADRYRGRGIASMLAQKCSRVLRTENVRYMLVEIWVYPDGRSPARRVYEKMGRTVLSSREDMFYKDAADYGISCPICGKKCICGAYIEVIDLSEPDSI